MNIESGRQQCEANIRSPMLLCSADELDPRASNFMAAHDPRLWETLLEFSQNLAIWNSRRMLLEQPENGLAI